MEVFFQGKEGKCRALLEYRSTFTGNPMHPRKKSGGGNLSIKHLKRGLLLGTSLSLLEKSLSGRGKGPSPWGNFLLYPLSPRAEKLFSGKLILSGGNFLFLSQGRKRSSRASYVSIGRGKRS